MIKREMTCIVCPLGCTLVAEMEENRVISVCGNTCPKGAAYAERECISPVRTVTTTVKCTSGALLPVKTQTPIPKEKVKDAMGIIDKVHPVLPIRAGDVIIENVFGSKVIATKSLSGGSR